MAEHPDWTGVPKLLADSAQPWFEAVANVGTIRGGNLHEAMSWSDGQIKRWVVTTPAMSDALREARRVSQRLAEAVDRGSVLDAERERALQAMDKLLDALLDAAPNENAKALGHAWR